MSELRSEIVESEKARTDLLKWKLIGVSALGATGLGFTEHPGTRGAYLVLPLIPLVCFYVDLMCRHINLRVIVIGRFLHLTSSGEQAAYESFVALSRQMGPKGHISVFALEDWALEWSTYFLSLLVVLSGIALPQLGLVGTGDMTISGRTMAFAEVVQYLFIASGLLGIVLTWITRTRYSRRIRMLDAVAAEPRLAADLMRMIAAGPIPSDGDGPE